jgi:phage terminase small subunit
MVSRGCAHHKQQRFANEYCIDLNATAAYVRAGYNARGNAAEACASRLLSNAKVQQAIQEKEKIAASRLEASTENVLRVTSALAFSDIRRLFNVDGFPSLSMNSMTQLLLLSHRLRSAR